MKNLSIMCLILFVVCACNRSEQKEAFFSGVIKDTLATLLKRYEREDIQAVQIWFRKSYSKDCAVCFEFYKNAPRDEAGYNFNEKKIFFFDDESDCAKSYIEKSYLKNKSINTGVILDGKIDTVNAVVPKIQDLYVIDKNGKYL